MSPMCDLIVKPLLPHVGICGWATGQDEFVDWHDSLVEKVVPRECSGFCFTVSSQLGLS